MKTCMTSCKSMQDLHEMARSCRLTAERVARRTCGQRPQGNAIWRFSVRRRPGKSKTKKTSRACTRCIAAFDCLDKVGKPTEDGTVRPAVQAGGTACENRTIWYNGDAKKNPRQRVRPECSKHISNYIRPGYL